MQTSGWKRVAIRIWTLTSFSNCALASSVRFGPKDDGRNWTTHSQASDESVNQPTVVPNDNPLSQGPPFESLDPGDSALNSNQWSGSVENDWNGDLDLVYDATRRDWMSLEHCNFLAQRNTTRVNLKNLSSELQVKFAVADCSEWWCQLQKLSYSLDVTLTEFSQVAWFIDWNPKKELVHVQFPNPDGACRRSRRTHAAIRAFLKIDCDTAVHKQKWFEGMFIETCWEKCFVELNTSVLQNPSWISDNLCGPGLRWWQREVWTSCLLDEWTQYREAVQGGDDIARRRTDVLHEESFHCGHAPSARQTGGEAETICFSRVFREFAMRIFSFSTAYFFFCVRVRWLFSQVYESWICAAACRPQKCVLSESQPEQASFRCTAPDLYWGPENSSSFSARSMAWMMLQMSGTGLSPQNSCQVSIIVVLCWNVDGLRNTINREIWQSVPVECRRLHVCCMQSHQCSCFSFFVRLVHSWAWLDLGLHRCVDRKETQLLSWSIWFDCLLSLWSDCWVVFCASDTCVHTCLTNLVVECTFIRGYVQQLLSVPVTVWMLVFALLITDFSTVRQKARVFLLIETLINSYNDSSCSVWMLMCVCTCLCSEHV